MDKIHSVDFGGLSVEISADAGTARYTFVGDIAESLDPSLLTVVDRDETIFDLEGIRSVNSCGVRTWVGIVRDFSSRTHLVFDKCSVSIVDQFNLVPQTLGHASIASFYAPYYCSTCDEEVTVLLRADTYQSELAEGTAPKIRHNCGTNLEFDALEDTYFQQLREPTKKQAG